MPATIFNGSKIKCLKDTLVNKSGQEFELKQNYIQGAYGDIDISGWTESSSGTWDITKNESSPLGKTSDIKLSKAASDESDEYIAYDFDLEDRHLSSLLKISFNYSTSANYEDDDVAVSLYDKDNSAYIEPVGFELKAGNGKFVASVQTDASSTNYDLRFVVNSTNASAYDIQIYDVKVEEYTPSFGTPITEEKDLNLTLTNCGDAVVSDAAYHRVGEFLNGRATITIGSTAPTGNLTINFTNFTFKAGGTNYLGEVAAYDISGSLHYLGALLAPSTSSLIIYGDGNNVWNATTPVTWASGDTIKLNFKVPIQGWGVSAQMSDVDSGRLIANFAKGANQTLTTSESTLTLDSTIFDTNAKVNLASDRIDFQESGKYIIIAHFRNAADGGSQKRINYSLYNTTSKQEDWYKATTNKIETTSYSYAMEVEANEYVQIKALVDSGTIDAYLLNLIVIKYPSSSAILASEKVYASYSTNAGQTINDATTSIINFEDKEIDNHGSVTTGAAWKFKAGKSGRANIKTAIKGSCGAGNLDEGEFVKLLVYLNGAEHRELDFFMAEASATANIAVKLNGSCAFNVNKGDYVDIRFNNETNSTWTLESNNARNYIDIDLE